MTFTTAATPMTGEGYLTARWTFRAFRSELAVHCNDWSIGYCSRETLHVQGGGCFDQHLTEIMEAARELQAMTTLAVTRSS